jgi:hypothetical protein
MVRPMSPMGRVKPGKAQNEQMFSSLAPCVDGSELARAFFTLQGWSVQPCVRPIDRCRHMTAGHNALRGSGPDQYPAFDNARG